MAGLARLARASRALPLLPRPVVAACRCGPCASVEGRRSLASSSWVAPPRRAPASPATSSQPSSSEGAAALAAMRVQKAAAGGHGGRRLVARYEERVAAGLCRRSEAQAPCLERLELLLAHLSGGAVGGDAPRGIYIYGDPGAGKTMMMDMFHDVVREAGLRSRRAHFHDFMLDMNRELHRIRKTVGGIQDPMALVAKAFVDESPLLCFDECHVLNVGDALLMRRFFEHLFQAGGTVVATSNLAPDELYSSGINREVFQPFIDAILGHCDPIRLTVGEDFRSTRSAELAASSGPRTFFWPLSPEADRQLGETLAKVLAGGGGAPLPVPTSGEIVVPMGRTLPCRRMWVEGAVKAAEFSYEELCARPVGTHDYIALCENFEVIVLTDVPRFGAADENAARRFASLVDVLYDRHKRLLCTIEAPPRELFAAIREQYSGGADDAVDLGASVRMPTHGGSSGKHVAQFKVPQAVSYTAHGRYEVTSADGGAGAGASAVGPRAVVDDGPDGGWVEWSATGLKDASMFDLTCHTKAQQHDRLLPLIRCESRLEEMSYLEGQAGPPEYLKPGGA